MLTQLQAQEEDQATARAWGEERVYEGELVDRKAQSWHYDAELVSRYDAEPIVALGEDRRRE
ncbi:MAG: hypothetical protein N3B14_00440 [Thermoleophilia bacterium]|nr:hypothetical protein [Thermoleophilia bacterium]